MRLTNTRKVTLISSSFEFRGLEFVTWRNRLLLFLIAMSKFHICSKILNAYFTSFACDTLNTRHLSNADCVHLLSLISHCIFPTKLAVASVIILVIKRSSLLVHPVWRFISRSFQGWRASRVVARLRSIARAQQLRRPDATRSNSPTTSPQGGLQRYDR